MRWAYKALHCIILYSTTLHCSFWCFSRTITWQPLFQFGCRCLDRMWRWWWLLCLATGRAVLPALPKPSVTMGHRRTRYSVPCHPLRALQPLLLLEAALLSLMTAVGRVAGPLQGAGPLAAGTPPTITDQLMASAIRVIRTNCFGAKHFYNTTRVCLVSDTDLVFRFLYCIRVTLLFPFLLRGH